MPSAVCDVFLYFPMQSLDDSVVSVGVSPVAGPVQLEGLRAELTERDKEVATLKQEQLLWQQEKEQELSSMKDKLTVSEVCADQWPQDSCTLYKLTCAVVHHIKL